MGQNENMLHIGGVACDKLAEACGTPVFLYDEKALEQKMDRYCKNFQSKMFATGIIYASKAFASLEMFRLIKDHGGCLDVVSGGELYLAKQAGMPMERVYFHGNNKTDDELVMALEYGCGTVVLDNETECERLIEKAESMKKEIHTIIRVNPGVNAHTHKYIVTGDPDSKFGTLIEDREKIVSMIQKVQNSNYVKFDGFHSHIGSQIFETGAFNVTIERLMAFMKWLLEEQGIACSVLDLGGGFGVRYTEEDKPMAIEDITQWLVDKCEAEIKKQGISLEKVLIEPGRSMVAEEGYTLYRVGYGKKTPNKEYLFVDGGMSDNIRVALYEAKYDCDLANKMKEEKTTHYSVAGKCCESGDILIEDILLPKAEEGDLLVVYSTGAYGYSMSNNYNRMRKLPVVFVKDGKARMVLKGETYEDMMRFETNEEVNL